MTYKIDEELRKIADEMMDEHFQEIVGDAFAQFLKENQPKETNKNG